VPNRRAAIASVLLALSGCETYVPVETPPIGTIERDYLLCFVLDTSGSFTPRMFSGDQLAYRFFLKASDQFFRNRMGPRDRILISQLSANNRTLLWEGSPLAMRRQFGSSAALQQFIEERSDPSGSRVYAAVADSLDYIHQLPGVREGKTTVCVLVLSDLMDSSATPDADRQRMLDAFSQFARTKACIGLYWVDQLFTNEFRKYLNDAGIKTYVVESDVVNDPVLPFADQ
jgi:hypothetical protein